MGLPVELMTGVAGAAVIGLAKLGAGAAPAAGVAEGLL